MCARTAAHSHRPRPDGATWSNIKQRAFRATAERSSFLGRDDRWLAPTPAPQTGPSRQLRPSRGDVRGTHLPGCLRVLARPLEFQMTHPGRRADAAPDEEDGGVYYETCLPDGTFANGVAPDVKQAMAAVKASQNGRLYSCYFCARAVDFNQVKEVWEHLYSDPGADPLPCYPGKLDSTRAFPAAPKCRDRKFARGLWPVHNNICGPNE